MKSRIEILDELAVKWGNKEGCESFEEYCQIYSTEAIITLVMQAMNQIELQGMKFGRIKATTNNNLLLKHQELTQWIEEEIDNEPDTRIFEVSHDFLENLYERVHKLNHEPY